MLNSCSGFPENVFWKPFLFDLSSLPLTMFIVYILRYVSSCVVCYFHLQPALQDYVRRIPVESSEFVVII
jgi:hypothetical protein